MMKNSNEFGLDTVNVSLLPADHGKGKKAFPLVISPRWDASLAFLIDWCKANRGWLDDMLLRYGAILVRGFDIDTAADLEQAIQAYQPVLHDTYRGTSPRLLMPGTKYVFSAAEVPVNYPIAQHIEMSFLPSPPKQLFFGCLKPSNAVGGETALADFRQVYRDLSPQLRQKLLDKGIRYQRTHKKVGTYFTYDVADMLGWPELFGTSDMAEVEQKCQKEGTPFEWKGDTFVSTTQSEAFQLHPISKEPVWFNHTQVFHWTTFPAELWHAWKRCREWRILLHCIFVTIFSVIKYGLFGRKMALYATFGDGEPIPISEMQEMRQTIHKNMVFNRWEKGDLLMIDNFSTSHGRQPTYDKGRKIVVAWGELLEKKNELTASSQLLVTSETKKEEEPIEIQMENPQERTA